MGRTVRRVPLDWNWPLNEIWDGFRTPEKFAEVPCTDCLIDGPYPHSDGYTEYGRHLHELWYGQVAFRPEDNDSVPFLSTNPVIMARAKQNVESDPWFYGGLGLEPRKQEAKRLARHFNNAWMHHLNEHDVRALVKEGALRSFTHHRDDEGNWVENDPMIMPSAEEVNQASLSSYAAGGYQGIVMYARAEREGKSIECPRCQGHGSMEAYPGQRDEYAAWKTPEPPTGEGWQLWETVSEGSPVSPVFATSEELAVWLTTEEGGAAAGPSGTPLRLEAARAFVGEGWAPSGVLDASGFHDGATFVGERAAAETKEIEA